MVHGKGEGWAAGERPGDDGGELMGFASYGPFRAFPAYKYTVEHSVYVDERFRGRGVGRMLLERVIEAAELAGNKMMFGVIDAENVTSIALRGDPPRGVQVWALAGFGVLSAAAERVGQSGRGMRGRVSDQFSRGCA
mgnify:CR=1 FL=1